MADFETVDDYIDAAITGGGYTSDNTLAKGMKISQANISQWRTKKGWPSERRMIELALLADTDPYEALVKLNGWRAKTPEVRAAYAHLTSCTRCAQLRQSPLSLCFQGPLPRPSRPPRPRFRVRNLYIMENSSSARMSPHWSRNIITYSAPTH